MPTTGVAVAAPARQVIGCAEAKIIRKDGGVEYHYALPYLPLRRFRARARVRAWLRDIRPAGEPITVHQPDRHGRVSSRKA